MSNHIPGIGYCRGCSAPLYPLDYSGYCGSCEAKRCVTCRRHLPTNDWPHVRCPSCHHDHTLNKEDSNG